jgi:hypothetical protein
MNPYEFDPMQRHTLAAFRELPALPAALLDGAAPPAPQLGTAAAMLRLGAFRSGLALRVESAVAALLGRLSSGGRTVPLRAVAPRSACTAAPAACC